MLLAGLLVGVMLGVAAGGKIAAETHRDGARSNLGEAGSDNKMRLGNGSGEASRESKRNSQAVGHPDDYVADGIASREVLLNVWRHGHNIKEGHMAMAPTESDGLTM